MNNIRNIKSGLIVILILTSLLWMLEIPPGDTRGGILAGLILLVTIACYWSIK